MVTSLGSECGEQELRERPVLRDLLVKPVRQGRLRDPEDGARRQGRAPSHRSPYPEPSDVPRHQKEFSLWRTTSRNQLVAVRAFSRSSGYRADVAANGYEALTAVRTIPYDLILMDCQMPEMDGYEATRRIGCRRASPATRSRSSP